MTCENCINYEWCSEQGKDLFSYNSYRNDAEIICGGFKHKGRFIEVPYHVGQTIYVTDHYEAEYSESGYVKFVIEDIRYSPICNCDCKNCENWFCGNNSNSDDKSKKVKCELTFIYAFAYTDCYETFTVEDIGKTVFLTEEEAAKAVRESKERG